MIKAAILKPYMRSPRNADGEHGDPQRHGEFDGDDFGQRDEQQRREPGILPAIVDDVADDMQPELAETLGHIAASQQHDGREDQRGDRGCGASSPRTPRRPWRARARQWSCPGWRRSQPAIHIAACRTDLLLHANVLNLPKLPGAAIALGWKRHINPVVAATLDGIRRADAWCAPMTTARHYRRILRHYYLQLAENRWQGAA